MTPAAEAAAQPEVEEEVVSDGLTLDLTNSHLRTLADVPLAPTLTVGKRLVAWQHAGAAGVSKLAPLWLIYLQALDLTANRLTGLEPNLLALTGHLPLLQFKPAPPVCDDAHSLSDALLFAAMAAQHAEAVSPSCG
jgi:hypothetical protein